MAHVASRAPYEHLTGPRSHADEESRKRFAHETQPPAGRRPRLWDGRAAARIVEILRRDLAGKARMRVA